MSAFLSSITDFFLADPAVRTAQVLVFGTAALLLFLLFYTLKDVFLRIRSFWLQALFVLMVALLPIGGFLLYILLRPARTLKEREMEWMLARLVDALPPEAEETLSAPAQEPAPSSAS